MKDWKFLFEKFVLGQHGGSKGRTEPAVANIILKASGECFVDIGFNRGEYTRMAEKRFKMVFSIDPNPKWNAPLQFAISDKDGYEQFYVGDNAGGADSLVKDPHILGIDWKNSPKLMVKCVTFDSLGIKADMVKIDVEGGEFKVIAGMNLNLPRSVIIELHDERRRQELLDLMKARGYSASQVDFNHWLFETR